MDSLVNAIILTLINFHHKQKEKNNSYTVSERKVVLISYRR